LDKELEKKIRELTLEFDLKSKPLLEKVNYKKIIKNNSYEKSRNYFFFSTFKIKKNIVKTLF
jgi:hypothetical protein